MTFTRAARMACLAFIANALAATATASDQHNFVVLIPEAIHSADVNVRETPALARLRDEGVFYGRTFSGFPEIGTNNRSRSAVYRAAKLVEHRRGGYDTSMFFRVRAVPSDEWIDEALTELQAEGRPFILIYRLPISDNGVASTLLVDTDRTLAAVEGRLKEHGLFDSTNIVVAAEHGRSTVAKQSRTSYTRDISFSGVPRGKLPPGFLAIDLIKAMLREDGGLNLYDSDGDGKLVEWWAGRHPRSGNAVIAAKRERPHVRIESHGGYDVIYMPDELDKAEVARRGRYIIENLFQQDYVSGVFVNEQRIGQVGGALSLDHLIVSNDEGDQLPDIVVSFTSLITTCDGQKCAVSVADAAAQEGDDLGTGFSRAETESFMAARGPDFREAFSSNTPASPADMMPTIEGLTLRRTGQHTSKDARELTESLRGFERTRLPKVRERVVESKPSGAGEHTVVHLLSVNGVDYFSAAGAPGQSLGLPIGEEPYYWHWESPLKLVRITIKP